MRHPRRESPGRRYDRLRDFVLHRDRWQCRKCGEVGDLEVDHVRRIKSGGATWDPENLQALCVRCHREKTRGENRSRMSPKLRDAVRAWTDDVDALRLKMT